MASLDDRWDALTDSAWKQFATCWFNGLTEREEDVLPDLPRILDEEQDAGDFVVQMSFTASHESHWKFITTAFELAPDENLGDIAAGPLEHVMWRHGDLYIDLIESMSQADPRFATMVDGCRQHKMSDENWTRIQAIQNRTQG